MPNRTVKMKSAQTRGGNPQSRRIERAAAYYARASAIRAIHGVLPEPDASADAKVWSKTIPSIKDEMRNMVSFIFDAGRL